MRAADSSAGAASSSAAGPSGGKGGSRGDPVVSTDHAVPDSDDRECNPFAWHLVLSWDLVLCSWGDNNDLWYDA